MPNFDFYRPSSGTYGHENGSYINSAPVNKLKEDFDTENNVTYTNLSTGNGGLTTNQYPTTSGNNQSFWMQAPDGDLGHSGSTQYEESSGIKITGFTADQLSQVKWWYRETSNQGGHMLWFRDSSGRTIGGAGTSNPVPTRYTGDSTGTSANVTPNYNTWYHWDFKFDWANNNITCDYEDGTWGPFTDNMVNTNATDIAEVHIGAASWNMNGSMDNWNDVIFDGR